MKFSYFLYCLILTSCLIACKKSKDDAPSVVSVDQLHQSVIYRTVATVPSPADYAKGLLKDSISISRNIKKGDPNFFENIPFVLSSIIRGNTGFTMSYHNTNNSLSYFGFTAYAFPNVPREFVLNQPYEHTTIPGSAHQKPIFLGSHTGLDGMTYFVNNQFPADAQYPAMSKVFTSITFTKKFKMLITNLDTAYYASGKIKGYCEDRYSQTDTNKYVHRWDFTVDFTDLRIN